MRLAGQWDSWIDELRFRPRETLTQKLRWKVTKEDTQD